MSPRLLMPLATVEVEPGYWTVVGTNVSVVAGHAVATHTRNTATASAASCGKRNLIRRKSIVSSFSILWAWFCSAVVPRHRRLEQSVRAVNSRSINYGFTHKLLKNKQLVIPGTYGLIAL